jgi:hypothetical protein
VGTGFGIPGPAADVAALELAGAVNCTGPTIGAAVAGGVHCAVMEPPGSVVPFGVVEAVAPTGLFEPLGSCPLPAGAPPPPLPPG